MEIPSQPSGSPEANIELQQTLLDHMQADISAKLFDSGAVTNILTTTSPTLSVARPTSVEGTDIFDKMFLPTVATITDGDHSEEEVSLAVVTPNPDTGRFFGGTYYRVGALDSTGTFFPRREVDPEAAEAVVAGLRDLRAAKGRGELPNLSYDLLGLSDPRMGIGPSKGSNDEK